MTASSSTPHAATPSSPTSAEQLQRQLDIAVLFVTHDQIDALALSDRIAVMRAGVIQQQGKPNELYEEPATEFVRDFIGGTIMFAGTTGRRHRGRRPRSRRRAPGTAA